MSLKKRLIGQIAVIIASFIICCLFNIISKDTILINILASFGSLLYGTIDIWTKK